MKYFVLDSFRRFSSLIYALLHPKCGRTKWVFVCLLMHIGTQTTFAQEVLGAELFATQISKNQFKITLYMHVPCNAKAAGEQQVVLFEQMSHKLVGVISLKGDSNYSNKFAPLSCKEAFDNCAQTQRYTTIYIADESRTTYDLVWAYQGLPAGLGNLTQPMERGISLSTSMVVDGGFTAIPVLHLAQLPFLQVCENQKTTFPLAIVGKDSVAEVMVEPIGINTFNSKENFGIVYPSNYLNTYKNLEGDSRFIGTVLPDIGPYQTLPYVSIKANAGNIVLDKTIKINPTKQEAELIKLPRGNFIQGLQISTMVNGMPITTHQAFFLFRIQ